jgi:glycerate kinase
MRKRILISPNSFKECADSVVIAELIKDNLSYLKDADLIVKPITDGGDGFLKVCQFFFGGEIRKYSISTAYGDSLFECPILYCENRKEIYIESAEVLGLKIVPLAYRNPLKLTSKGLGELLRKIEEGIHQGIINVQKVYIGIGGTATIDMGIGMMSELGLELLDSSNLDINVLPENFSKVRGIEYKPFDFSFDIISVVDVTNPLVGEQGGIRVFGKQKGAIDTTISIIEEGFSHLVNLFENNGLQFSYNKLSGAGGGIPAALQIFYNSQLLYSSEFIEHNLGFNKYSDSDNIDYLITGEGAYDNQSEFGKGADVLINLFNGTSKQLFLLCGIINSKSVASLPKNVIPISLVKYFENESDSVIKYKVGIEKGCQDIVKHLNF